MPACRGSPCELPEETIEGYQAALDHGIDFIELDAVQRHSLGMLQLVAQSGVTAPDSSADGSAMMRGCHVAMHRSPPRTVTWSAAMVPRWTTARTSCSTPPLPSGAAARLTG